MTSDLQNMLAGDGDSRLCVVRLRAERHDAAWVVVSDYLKAGHSESTVLLMDAIRQLAKHVALCGGPKLRRVAFDCRGELLYRAGDTALVNLALTSAFVVVSLNAVRLTNERSVPMVHVAELEFEE